MTPRFPSTSGKKVARVLEQHGFRLVRQTGSHAIFRHSDGRRVTVPMHGNQNLGQGLLMSIMRESKIPFEDFIE